MTKFVALVALILIVSVTHSSLVDGSWFKSKHKPEVATKKDESRVKNLDEKGQPLWLSDSDEEWLSGSKVFNKETDCTESDKYDLVKNLAVSRSKKNSYKIMKDYFALYLDVCGFEKRFKKVIEMIIIKPNSDESWVHTRSPLYNYFRAEFLEPKSRFEDSSLPFAVRVELSIIEDFSDMEAISENTDCTDEKFKTKLVKTVGWSKERNSKLAERIYDYFSLYIRQCGFEEIFKNAMIQQGFGIEPGNSPLASYISDVLEEPAHKDENVPSHISSMLDIVNKLPELKQIDKSKCSEENTKLFENFLCKARENSYNKLATCIYFIFHGYLQGCKDHFKDKAKEFVSNNKETWSFIKKSGDIIGSIWKAGYISSFVLPAAYHYIHGSDWENPKRTPETEKFARDLKGKCTVLWNYMHQDMYTMSFDMEHAAKNEEIMGFMKYLSLCSHLVVKKLGYEKINIMLKYLGAPYYEPIKKDSYPRPQDCEKGYLYF